jgi:small subunit ribosomal protein S5
VAYQGQGKRERRRDSREDEFERKIISIRRVAKQRAGAKRLRFSAVVAIGDKKGRVCVALGKGGDTKSAIGKAAKYGADHLTHIDMIGDTIPHAVTMKYAAARVLLRPAGPGTGVIASESIRFVLEVAGIRNVLTKQFGSKNPVTNAYCTYKALKMLSSKRIIERRSQQLRTSISGKSNETPSDTKTK